jgi:alkylation response protein AidB-like acyl-CoA dehydrogenase
MFGASAAIGYAFTAALTKEVTHYVAVDWTQIFGHWQTYGLVVFGVLAVFLTQNAFHAGPIGASQAALVLVDPLVSISIGIALFGDNLQTGGFHGPLEALSLLVLLAGGFVLSHSSATAILKGDDTVSSDLLAPRLQGPFRRHGPATARTTTTTPPGTSTRTTTVGIPGPTGAGPGWPGGRPRRWLPDTGVREHAVSLHSRSVDFSLTDEDRAFELELRTWLDEHLGPFLAETEDEDLRGGGGNSATASQARRKAWQRLLNEGRWAAVHWPTEWGGRETTPVQRLLYSEIMAEYRTPGIYNPNGIWQIGPMLIQWGTEEQKKQWLPSIIDAEDHWCQGFSEPDAGNDLANLRTTAILDGDEYVVNGQKIWTSTAHLARWGLFLLRTDPTAIERGAKHEGITAFIIDLETEGIDIRPIRDMAGEEMFNEIFFTDARIPVTSRLGGEGEGWMVAMTTLGHERVGIAGQITSLAADLRAVVEAARAVNPTALEDEGLRDRLARTWTEIELARLLVYRALSKVIRGEKNWPEVPFSKLQYSLLAQTLAELAVDLLGPLGLLARGGPDAVDRGKWTRLYAFQRYSTIGGGSTEVQKDIIADRAIKLPGRTRLS